MAKTSGKTVRGLRGEFGTLSLGKQKIRLPITVSRDEFEVAKFDELFCGKRCEVKLTIDPNAGGDAAGQGRLVDTDVVIQNFADIMGYRVSPKAFAFSLQFQEDPDLARSLISYTGAVGTLDLKSIGSPDSARGPKLAGMSGDDGDDEDGGETDED